MANPLEICELVEQLGFLGFQLVWSTQGKLRGKKFNGNDGIKTGKNHDF